MLVGFDTNILVYTLQTPGNPNLDREQKKAPAKKKDENNKQK